METPTIDIAIGSQYPKKVIPLIEAAKKSISIIVYDWRWYPDQIGAQIQLFNNAIVRQYQKGLDVRAVVWNREIYNLLKGLDIRVKLIAQSKLLHIKLMIIDDEIAILGSHNYTKNAFDVNFEASVIIHDDRTAAELKKLFQNFFY